MTVFFTLTALVFGACIGSFLNVVIWRLPRKKDLGGRSHCPHCNHTLVWYDLIPLLSFVFNVGRCRYCQQPISLRYPLIEFITGVLFSLAYLHFAPQDLISWLILVKITVIISVCIAVFVIDLEHYLILDRVMYPAMATILLINIALSLVSGSSQSLLFSLLSALGAFLLFWLVWFFSKGKWMGFGDVKLAAWMGLALAWPGVAVALFASFIVGALVGIFLMVFAKKQMTSQVPFGTFLSAATVLAAFYGPKLWDVYWALYQF